MTGGVGKAGLWHQNDFIANPAAPHSVFVTCSFLILIYSVNLTDFSVPSSGAGSENDE